MNSSPNVRGSLQFYKLYCMIQIFFIDLYGVFFSECMTSAACVKIHKLFKYYNKIEFCKITFI